MGPLNDNPSPHPGASPRQGGEPTLLVVDDEASTRTVIRARLGKEPFQVLEAGSGEGALAMLEGAEVDLVLLDAMLPGMDGFEVCRHIRARGGSPAIIMLTQLAEREAAIRGLLLGADDYMTKPFDPEELVARVKAVLRRTREWGAQLEFGNLKIDLRLQKCSKSGRDLELTPKEFTLLAVLCAHPGQSVSRAELSRLVWGEQRHVSAKSLDVYIRRLRQKVEDHPDRPVFILTERGCGYRWQ
jgi:DNA-binding response OmpR family regulator